MYPRYLPSSAPSGEEHRRRPAVVAVPLLDVRPRVGTSHLRRDEVPVERSPGQRGVVVGRGLHHVAPVAPLGGAIEDDELVLGLGAREGRRVERGPGERSLRRPLNVGPLRSLRWRKGWSGCRLGSESPPRGARGAGRRPGASVVGMSGKKACLARIEKRIVLGGYALGGLPVPVLGAPAARPGASSPLFPFAHLAQIEDAPPASRGICRASAPHVGERDGSKSYAQRRSWSRTSMACVQLTDERPRSRRRPLAGATRTLARTPRRTPDRLPRRRKRRRGTAQERQDRHRDDDVRPGGCAGERARSRRSRRGPAPATPPPASAFAAVSWCPLRRRQSRRTPSPFTWSSAEVGPRVEALPGAGRAWEHVCNSPEASPSRRSTSTRFSSART